MNQTFDASLSAINGPNDDEREYTLRELAVARGKSLVTIRRWVIVGVHKVILPSYMVGGRRMVNSRDLLDWIRRLSRV